MNSQVWWFVSRSSGIVAWALVTLAVCWGLFLGIRAVARTAAPGWLLDLHRYLGGVSLVFVAIHLVGLWADGFVHFAWAELFVPMASSWRPGAVAWGIVAMYLLVAVEITSLLMRRVPRRWWKAIHQTSFPLYFMATYHGLVAGSEADNDAFRFAVVFSINVVAMLTITLIVSRWRAARTRVTRAQPTVMSST
jgi:DMSO/TMAO reductase YedYZ heme-binding membrane subunit